MLRYINNCPPPPPMSHLPLVEVYNCGVGSSDCSQCWGREDQGHLCAWCDNSCKPRDDCQPIRDQCPAPEINTVRSHVNHAWLWTTNAYSPPDPSPTLFNSLQALFSNHKMANHGVTHMVWCPRALSVQCQLLRECLYRVSLKKLTQ